MVLSTEKGQNTLALQLSFADIFNITDGKFGLTKQEIKAQQESKNQTSVVKIKNSEYYYKYF